MSATKWILIEIIVINAEFFFRYMVDAADHEKLEASRNELHGLLEKPQLAGIPVSNTLDSLLWEIGQHDDK